MFYDELVKVVSKFSENELVIIGEDLNDMLVRLQMSMKESMVEMVLGCKIWKVRGVLEFAEAMDMVVCNTLFTKRDKKLIYKNLVEQRAR